MKNQPWNSIAESITEEKGGPQSFSQALESPCLSCSTSPCCTHLPLTTFQVRNIREFDYARYLLNFDRIELGISPQGKWSAYYSYPCRFLDREAFTCTIHNKPEQPRICVNYNPYGCWYKKVFTKSVEEDYIRLDRQRFEIIANHTVFDEKGTLTQAPDWEWIRETITALPLVPADPIEEPPIEDPLTAKWKAAVIQNKIPSPPAEQPHLRHESLKNPCIGCQAYCCKKIVFPHPWPTTYSNLDYLKFSLGFPGIELGISEQGIAIVLSSSCRHFKEGKCAVYDQPERPLICKYYDEWQCTFKPNFEQIHPNNYVRLTFQEYDSFLEGFRFDEQGKISQYPTINYIRERIESSWKAETQQ